MSNFSQHIIIHIKLLYDVYLSNSKLLSNTNTTNESTHIGMNIHMNKSFSYLLKTYYPYATRDEIKSMCKIIEPQKLVNERKEWSNYIRLRHTKDILDIFGTIDIDDSKSIDIEEFSKSIKLLNWTEEDITELFNMADKNHDGLLDIEEFIDLLSKNHSLKTNFMNILYTEKEHKYQQRKSRLSIMFNDVDSPSSPLRNHWRPSLANCKSPTTIYNNVMSAYSPNSLQKRFFTKNK